MLFSGAWEKMIHKKAWAKKSRDTIPLRPFLFCICTFWPLTHRSEPVDRLAHVDRQDPDVQGVEHLAGTQLFRLQVQYTVRTVNCSTAHDTVLYVRYRPRPWLAGIEWITNHHYRLCGCVSWWNLAAGWDWAGCMIVYVFPILTEEGIPSSVRAASKSPH
jgi:hypothetical protein